MKLAILALVATALAAPLAAGASALRPAAQHVLIRSANVEDEFVAAANRGDYVAVCRLYSRRYLKASQQSCRSLYRWGEAVFGPYDYRIVRRGRLTGGHRRIDLTLRHHPTFIEVAHERAGWRIVAGGW